MLCTSQALDPFLQQHADDVEFQQVHLWNTGDQRTLQTRSPAPKVLAGASFIQQKRGVFLYFYAGPDCCRSAVRVDRRKCTVLRMGLALAGKDRIRQECKADQPCATCPDKAQGAVRRASGYAWFCQRFDRRGTFVLTLDSERFQTRCD